MDEENGRREDPDWSKKVGRSGKAVVSAEGPEDRSLRQAVVGM